MPIGTKNGTAIFQRVMDHVLQGLGSADVYINDINICTSGDTEEELGLCDPIYRKPNLVPMILSTLPPPLKGLINTQVAEATQRTGTAPTLNDF